MAEEPLIVNAIIEIMGAPKDYIMQTMDKVIEKVKEGYTVRDFKVHEAREMEKFWSTFVEMELRIKKVDDLIGFCFDFMPSSIEISEPSRMNVENTDVNNLFNELLARLHQYDMVVKNLNAQNKLLQQKQAEKK